jgi:hypothetical protein
MPRCPSWTTDALFSYCKRAIVLSYCDETISHVSSGRRARQSQVVVCSIPTFAFSRPANKNIARLWLEFLLLTVRLQRAILRSVPHPTPLLVTLWISLWIRC